MSGFILFQNQKSPNKITSGQQTQPEKYTNGFIFFIMSSKECKCQTLCI